jgi:sugar transferase EpsL
VRDLAKRGFDAVGAVVLLVLLSPLLAAIPLAVRLRMGAPVLFRQERPGLHGRLFTLLKFRTMSDRRGADGQLLPDADRLTRLGRFLRRTSLDELPELVNVVRGEMSLVGPRPLLKEYLPLYTTEQARRHEVRPGITGWTQVNGRNALTWEEKFVLDVWYVDHRSMHLDLEILLKTCGQVVSGRGVSAPGHATMEPYQGPHP